MFLIFLLEILETSIFKFFIYTNLRSKPTLAGATFIALYDSHQAISNGIVLLPEYLGMSCLLKFFNLNLK